MSILKAATIGLKCISYTFLFVFFTVSISTCSASDRHEWSEQSERSSISINWDASKDPEQEYKPNKGYESELKDKYNPKCGYSEYCPSTDKD